MTIAASGCLQKWLDWLRQISALANLAQLGTRPLSAPLGAPGARRACVRNPDGVYVEIMEDDPLASKANGERQDCPVAIRSVTMSTPNLADSAAYMSKGIGHNENPMILHTPEHEALWGLAGAKSISKLFEAGGVLVEVMQYLDPIGKPWPAGYRDSVHIDAGIEQVWAAIADHEGMLRSSGFSPISVIRDGDLERNGYGSERLMQGRRALGIHGRSIPGSALAYRNDDARGKHECRLARTRSGSA